VLFEQPFETILMLNYIFSIFIGKK